MGQGHVSPAEARLGMVIMLLLSVLALAVAGWVASAGSMTQAGLFAGLAAVGMWQADVYRRRQ